MLPEFTKGIIRENPLFVQLLGVCPALATTSSLTNALGMGAAFTAVLIGSNLIISALKKFIPANIRIPAYIVVIASLVTVTEMLMNAYVPAIYESLGIFIPLIVVNCIILGRAEAFASKNGLWLSFQDAVGMGIGFTLALSAIGACREFFGAGTLLGHAVALNAARTAADPACRRLSDHGAAVWGTQLYQSQAGGKPWTVISPLSFLQFLFPISFYHNSWASVPFWVFPKACVTRWG